MGLTNNGSLRNCWMSHQSTFHFGGTNAMPRYVEDIIDTTSNEVEAVLVTKDRVTGKVEAWVGLHVDCHVPLVITQACTGHTRPRLADGKDALDVIAFNNLSVLNVKNDKVNTVEWKSTRTRLHGRDTRKVGHDVSSRLRLPVRINDTAFAVANVLVVPSPGFRIDGFSDTSKYLQRRQVVLGRNLISKAHQETDSCWCSVELRNLVSLDHVPVSARIGVDGRRLKHKRRSSIQQWSVDNIRVSRNPTAVSNTSKEISLCQVKCRCSGCGGIQGVSSTCVHKSLGHSRGSRGVQDEKVVFSIHNFRCAIRSLSSNKRVHSNVLGFHLEGRFLGFWIVESLEHQHVLDNLFAVNLGHCIVDDILEWDRLSSTPADIGCHNKLGSGGADTRGKGLG
mmetsp:Transcript_35528/g.52903  ORF Transcript_35528/g.52903 Transcript_35528/m.52903 type:complete len:394 (-) Transcript_35528:703-1884(-)